MRMMWACRQGRSEGDLFVARRADGRARQATLGVGARAGLGQELHAKRDDLVLAALVALLVLPGPIPQPAFEQDRVALVEVWQRFAGKWAISMEQRCSGGSGIARWDKCV